MMETTIIYYNDSGFFSRSEVLGSHTESIIPFATISRFVQKLG
jgi:hypothetical protein